jgi:hypothetical protein
MRACNQTEPQNPLIRDAGRHGAWSGTMNIEKVIESKLKENPEVRLVLQIAARARDLEALEPPREIGLATDIVAIPSKSQCLVPPMTSGRIQTT